MSRRGQVLDNAAMESWNSTFKMECGERFDSQEIAKDECFEYVEMFYNGERRHSSLGYISPAEYERRYRQRQDEKAA
jgi:putative transposase